MNSPIHCKKFMELKASYWIQNSCTVMHFQCTKCGRLKQLSDFKSKKMKVDDF